MRASIVIRARDKEADLRLALAALAAQTERDVEVILVDNGSTDGTVAVAHEAGAQVVELAEFTYGRALNAGAERAGADVVVALSAHSHPDDPRWLERLLETMAGERVACASGQDRGPDGRPLTGPLVLEGTAHPYYGYSNHAGAFRTELWREHPFREDMPYSEDREWAWHWLTRGRRVVIDPALIVRQRHTSEPAREQYRRARATWIGYGMYLDVEPPSGRAAVREWWSERESYPNAASARLSPKRVARLAGGFAGRRAASRARK